MGKHPESTISRLVLLAAVVVAGGLTIGLLLSLLTPWRAGSEQTTGTTTNTAVISARGQPSAGSERGETARVSTDPASAVRAGNPTDSASTSAASTSTSAGGRASAGDAYVSAQARANRDRPAPLPFDCDSSFRTNDTHETLVRRYGANNVTSDSILLGEGQYETGTILFASDSLRRAEIMWRDTTLKRNPRVVSVRGREAGSAWQTRDGIALQTDLRTIESLNGRPFRLTGFGWDYGGTVMSWEQGRLQHYSSLACDIRMRLSPNESDIAGRLFRQVIGEAQFSSGHPSMKALNPRVTELFLQFK